MDVLAEVLTSTTRGEEGTLTTLRSKDVCPKEATYPLQHPWDAGWFSVGFGTPLLHLAGVGVRVDTSLCGITSRFLSLHGWLEHENAS